MGSWLSEREQRLVGALSREFGAGRGARRQRSAEWQRQAAEIRGESYPFPKTVAVTGYLRQPGLLWCDRIMTAA